MPPKSKSNPNPYDFVPLEASQPIRLAWSPETYGIDRYQPDRYSGRICCILHPETPIFVHGQGQQGGNRRSFFRIDGKPGIPAASLKGAIRSIYEIVTDSCLSSVSDEYKASRPIKISQRLPSDAYKPCHTLSEVCPACMLFGMVEQEVKEARGVAGRLSFSDAVPVKILDQWQDMPKQGGGPQPRHASFYFQNGGAGKILGRKLYYHHQDYQATIKLYGDGGRPGLMKAELQSGDFTFQIDFVNLTEAELNNLCYTLLLEEEIRHHMAYGKAYGLGSARILISQIDLHCSPTRPAINHYLHMQPDIGVDQNSKQRAEAGKKAWLQRKGGQDSYNAFKRILTWPGVDLYKYPSYGWFRHTDGSANVTLSQYQSGIRTVAGSASPSQAGQRMRGQVEQFNQDRGFGFIRSDNRQKFFVHFSGIRRGGPRSLEKGQRVEFSVEETEKGPRAVDVVLLKTGGD